MSGSAFPIAVLLSGSGTTLENLCLLKEAGALPIEITTVISSRADAYGLERARQRGIPTSFVERQKLKVPASFSDAIYAALQPYQPQLIVLAGFMSFLEIRPDFEHRVINTHPALLPAFGGKGYYGNHVHEAVLAQGCKVTGCTVHFVDNQYDHGPIIAQQAVAVKQDDTPESLAARVQAAERLLLPETIRWIAAGQVSVRDGRVNVREA